MIIGRVKQDCYSLPIHYEPALPALEDSIIQLRAVEIVFPSTYMVSKRLPKECESERNIYEGNPENYKSGQH